MVGPHSNVEKSTVLTTLVTGATGDIGRAIVVELVTSGIDVRFQYSRNSAAAEEIQKITRTEPIRLDFSDSVDFDIFEDVDAVVLAHGVNESRGLVHEVSDEQWDHTLRINVRASFQLLRKLLPGMVERGFGRVVAVNSIYGLRGSTHNLPYNVSRHALSGMIKTIALEYGRYGVTANEICPGPVESTLLTRVSGERAAREGISIDDYLESLRHRIPSADFVQADTIARLARQLVAEPTVDINGTSIVVDGGLLS